MVKISMVDVPNILLSVYRSNRIADLTPLHLLWQERKLTHRHDAWYNI